MLASNAGAELFTAGAQTGWEAAMLELEHQAEHWDTPDHGETGHLIASALRAAVEIARDGGPRCEHRGQREESRALEKSPGPSEVVEGAPQRQPVKDVPECAA